MRGGVHVHAQRCTCAALRRLRTQELTHRAYMEGFEAAVAKGKGGQGRSSGKGGCGRSGKGAKGGYGRSKSRPPRSATPKGGTPTGRGKGAPAAAERVPSQGLSVHAFIV